MIPRKYAYLLFSAAVLLLSSLLLLTIQNNVELSFENVFGMILQSLYLLIFLYFNPSPRRFGAILSMVVFGLVFTVLVAHYGFKDPVYGTDLLGSTAPVFNLLMYASPLSAVFVVVETKSVRYKKFEDIKFVVEGVNICVLARNFDI